MVDLGRPRRVRWAVAVCALVLAVGLSWWLYLPVRGAGRQSWAVRRYIVAGVPLFLPPFGAPRSGGGWVGLDVELARQVAQAALGNPGRVHVLPLEPGQRVWAVRTGAADIVMAGYSAGDPAAAPVGVRLIGPYLTAPLALLVRRGDPVRAWSQLDGREVGVLSGRTALRRAAGPSASYTVEETEVPGAAARGLALGHLRALVGPLPVLQALSGYDPALAVQQEPLLGSERYWVMVPGTAAALVPAVEKGIAALPQGAALQRLLTQWANAVALPAPRPLLTLYLAPA